MRNMRPKEPISVDVTNEYFGPHLGVAYGENTVDEVDRLLDELARLE